MDNYLQMVLPVKILENYLVQIRYAEVAGLLRSSWTFLMQKITVMRLNFTLKTILQAPDSTVLNQIDDRKKKMNGLSSSLTSLQIFFAGQ